MERKVVKRRKGNTMAENWFFIEDMVETPILKMEKIPYTLTSVSIDGEEITGTSFPESNWLKIRDIYNVPPELQIQLRPTGREGVFQPVITATSTPASLSLINPKTVEQWEEEVRLDAEAAAERSIQHHLQHLHLRTA